MKRKAAILMLAACVFLSLVTTVFAIGISETSWNTYSQVLDYYAETWGTEWVYYTLCDIDNNGEKELVVGFGGSDGFSVFGKYNNHIVDYEVNLNNVLGLYLYNKSLYEVQYDLFDAMDDSVSYDVQLIKIELKNNAISQNVLYDNIYVIDRAKVDTNWEMEIPQIAEIINNGTEVNFINISDRSLLGVDYVEENEYNRILAGDFSAVAGEYVTSSGDVMTLLPNGLTSSDVNDNEMTFAAEDISKEADGTYQWGIQSYYNGEAFDGVWCILYPVGVNVIAYDGTVLKTDTSKIRLWMGQDVVAYAEYIYTKKDNATTKEIEVILDGAKIAFDQPPVMIDNRVMVPVRAIFEAMGYSVDWNAGNSTAVAVKGSDRIIVRTGNSVISYTVGGRSDIYRCDVAPQIISDRVLVPVRAIAESAGCTVEWDNLSQTVHIYTRETDTDSEIENYLKGSTWILDADRTYAETGVSLQTMFGTSIKYGSEMTFGSDGEFEYYVAAGYGGTGTYTVDDGYIQFTITPYEDDVESGVIYFDSERKSLIMKIGGYNTHWKLSMDYDKILYENNVMDYAYLLPDDYDGDGRDEAYIIVALPVDDWAEWDEFQEIEAINIYFISSDGSFYKVDSLDGVGVYTGKVTVSNGKFVTIEMSYGGSSSFTKIYGCNDGIPFVPQISGKVGGFCLSGDKYVYYADDFSKGYHDYVETELEYDANTREFSVERGGF